MLPSGGSLRRPDRDLLISLAVFVLALWAELLLDQWTGRFVFVAFAPAIAISAWLGGASPAFLLIALSSIATDYFLFGPGDLLRFDSGAEGAALAVFVSRVDRRCADYRVGRQACLAGERQDKLAAERVAAQAHRIAQSTAALGQVRTSAEAIAAALHEPLHWLRAGAGVFYLLSEDRLRITVAQVAGYQLNEGDLCDLETFGDTRRSPNRCAG